MAAFEVSFGTALLMTTGPRTSRPVELIASATMPRASRQAFLGLQDCQRTASGDTIAGGFTDRATVEKGHQQCRMKAATWAHQSSPDRLAGRGRAALPIRDQPP